MLFLSSSVLSEHLVEVKYKFPDFFVGNNGGYETDYSFCFVYPVHAPDGWSDITFLYIGNRSANCVVTSL